ncbi:lytic transglycosylase domain-containing protein [Ferroacidibacillus organovorans]|nr:lytic transglycosylase domain-containing protein [Ferroacidibacillus organovorans]
MNLDPLRASSTTNLPPGEVTAKMRGGAAASQALPSSGLTAFQSALLQTIAQTELSGLSALSLSGSLSGTSMTSGSSLTSLLGGTSGSSLTSLLGGTSGSSLTSLLGGMSGSSLTSLLGGMSGTASGGLLGGTSSQLLSLMLATAAQSGSTANLSNLAAALGGVTGFSSGSSLSPATLQTLGAPMQTFSNPSSAETPSSSSGSATTAHYEAMIAALAPQYGLSPSLVSAVVKQESNFSANATSQAGAMGLMQLMPQTAQSLGVTNAYDPVQNLQAGMSYLSQLIHRYHGDVPLALAAYNAGPSTVDAFGGIPPYPETQNYVSSIMQSVSATP